MGCIQALRFCNIEVRDAKYNPKTRTASLFINLTGKDRIFRPKKPSLPFDFTLFINRGNKIQAEYYWPGAGNRISLTPADIVPLIRQLIRKDNVWLAPVKGTYENFQKALQRFQRVTADVIEADE